jgi:tRNA dimethylallyltransferase
MQLEDLKKLAISFGLTAENLDFNNPRRLIRAIEKIQEGTSATKNKPNFESLLLAIDIPREELYQRIDKRVDMRFEKQGMLEEVKNLISHGVDPNWLKSLGLEYKFITLHLEGEYSFDQMAQELKWKTHAYARRQLVWLRKQAGLIWIKDKQEAADLVDKFLKVL